MNHPLFYCGGSAYFLFLFHLCQQVVSKLVLWIISVYRGIYLASLLYLMDSISILTTVYCLGMSISQVGLARVVTRCLSRIP
uniref:Putative ovule protein n=1 Tax=Solanum chacoense TaxID=4108 RepID=A0A0V0GSN7_SOLCH